MKDVSQCLLSIIDEFEKYHSKIVSLESASKEYNKNVQVLKASQHELLQVKKEKSLALKSQEEETEVFLHEYEKLEGRYKYAQSVINELRDENAYMNTDILKLKDENIAYKDDIKRLKEELKVSKAKEYSSELESMLHTYENLKTKNLLSEQAVSRLSAENIQLKQRFQEFVQDKLANKHQVGTLKTQYVKMKNEKENIEVKFKELEFEFNGLKKLYDNALREKSLLKKKAEDLILEKYNKMYETKHLFGVDVDSIRGQNNYVDIDSLIDGIDSKSQVDVKALA